MVAIALWTLVGLFWAIVIGVSLWKRDEARRARMDQLVQVVALKTANGVDWVNVHVLRRKSIFLIEDEEADKIIVDYLISKGIRAISFSSEGKTQLLVHPDDHEKFRDLLAQYGGSKGVVDEVMKK